MSSPPLRKTISVPIGYTPAQFKTFDSELIQKLDQRHSISDRHNFGNFRSNFRSNQLIQDEKEEMEKKSHDDGLNEILNSKDISRRPLEERIEPEVNRK